MTEKPNHADRGHCEYGPSALKCYAACSGYEKQNEEGKDMTAANKGTRIHEALEVRDPSSLHNEEEHDIYEMILKMEESFLKQFPEEGRVDQDEIRLDMELFDDQSTFGTCDRFIRWKGSSTAVLADYKTGVSVIDDTKDNWQAKDYSIGIFQAHPEIEMIIFVFYVPFHDGTEASDRMIHTFHRHQLEDLMREVTDVILKAKYVKLKRKLGLLEISDLNPNDNCRFCRWEEEGCPALGAVVVGAAKAAGILDDDSLLDFDTDSKDPEAVSKRYRVAKIIEKWSKREKEQAVQMAKDGVELPDLVLKSKGAATVCTDDDKLVNIARLYGVTDEQVREASSITLGKVAAAAGANAPHGEKGATEEKFLADAKDAGILQKQAERFTLEHAKD